MSISRRRRAAVVTAVLVACLTACGEGPPEADDGKITLYSGRTESLIKPLLERFSDDTGIEVEARYGSTAQLAAQLLEEGESSRADAFLAQDAGALGAVNKKGLFAALPPATLDKVPDAYQAADGRWVGVSARSRVLAYNPTLVPAAQLPTSVFDLTQPQWKGKVGVAPTNASFQAFVTAMRVQHGDERARQFLTGLKANEPQVRDGNIAIVEEIAAGKLAVGLVNHYYVGELAKERGVTPDRLGAKLHFFPRGDTGALVNTSGIGTLKGSAQDPDTKALVDYLLGPEAQKYFAEETFEYPLASGVAGPAGVPELTSLTGPPINLNDLDDLSATVSMIKESGLTP